MTQKKTITLVQKGAVELPDGRTFRYSVGTFKAKAATIDAILEVIDPTHVEQKAATSSVPARSKKATA